jgi:hypothetical protein
MVDNIVWRRFPYYVERTVHKRFANEQDDWTEREKERYKKNKSINAAYESYHLLWDDFMNTLRDIRERPHALPTERALYAAPSALELTGKTGSPATVARDAAKKAFEDAQQEERDAKAALEAAKKLMKKETDIWTKTPNPSPNYDAQEKVVAAAGQANSNADDKYNDAINAVATTQTAYTTAEEAWRNERDTLLGETRILYMKRWTRLQELAEEMAENEYVVNKNESAGVSRTSYIDSLLAMVFA